MGNVGATICFAVVLVVGDTMSGVYPHGRSCSGELELRDGPLIE